MELTSCPQCEAPAEVIWRFDMASTDGPIEHIKILCLDRHWFLLPAADVERPDVHAPHATPEATPDTHGR